MNMTDTYKNLQPLALAVLCCAGLLTLPAHAAKDPYLDAIQAEGDRLEFLGQAQKEQEALMRAKAAPAPAAKAAPGKPATPAVAAAKPAAATSATSNAEFETQLRESFPGSFALYSIMQAKDKEVVYSEFQKSKADGPGRFLPVVTKIITITTARNKEKGVPNR